MPDACPFRHGRADALRRKQSRRRRQPWKTCRVRNYFGVPDGPVGRMLLFAVAWLVTALLVLWLLRAVLDSQSWVLFLVALFVGRLVAAGVEP